MAPPTAERTHTMLTNFRHGMFTAVAVVINVLFIAIIASPAMTAPLA
jgi:hypothetical protein